MGLVYCSRLHLDLRTESTQQYIWQDVDEACERRRRHISYVNAEKRDQWLTFRIGENNSLQLAASKQHSGCID